MGRGVDLAFTPYQRAPGQSHLKKIAGEDGKTVLLEPYLRRLKRVRQSPRPCEF